MDNKTTAILAVIGSSLICGVPGLFMLCFGSIMAFTSLVPGADIDIQGSSDPRTALLIGSVVLFLGLVFVAVPVLVGFISLRKRRRPTIPSDEPIPPAL